MARARNWSMGKKNKCRTLRKSYWFVSFKIFFFFFSPVLFLHPDRKMASKFSITKKQHAKWRTLSILRLYRFIKTSMMCGFLPLLSQQEGIKRAESLIAVMTAEERREPRLLISDPTSQQRLRRIAKDAGVKLSAVSVSQPVVMLVRVLVCHVSRLPPVGCWRFIFSITCSVCVK